MAELPERECRIEEVNPLVRLEAGSVRRESLTYELALSYKFYPINGNVLVKGNER
jgi:hypothetical protein